MNSFKLAKYTLIVSNTCFLLLYISLCYHNRLALDDFHFLANINDHGVILGTIAEYETWNSRWIALLINHFVLRLIQQSGISLFLFGIFNLVLYSSAIGLLLNTLFKSVKADKLIQPIPHNKSYYWLILNLSIYLVSILFITSIRIDETWFWLCTSTMYLWSCIMFVFGISYILNQSKKLWISVIGIIPFLYIGGSSGPLALITMLILALLLFFTSTGKIQFYKNLTVQRLSIAFISCLSGFVVLYIANGNEIRESFFEEISVAYSLALNFKMLGIIFLKRLLFVLPLMLVLGAPMLTIGSFFPDKGKKHHWKLQLVKLAAIYYLIVFFYQLSITYKTQDIGANRALYFISVITVTAVLVLFYFIGRHFNISKLNQKYVLLIPLIISSILFGYHFINQTIITYQYAKAYDDRIEYVMQERDDISVLELDPLPSSGMLLSAELSEDTSHFTNKQFKKGLKLPFSVKLRTD